MSSASPATPSNVDSIGPPAAKRPKPQTTPPSSSQRSQSSPAMKCGGGGAGGSSSSTASSMYRSACAQMSQQQQQSPAGFICAPNSSLNDLPETSSDLIDDLCMLPADVFSQTSNSPSNSGPGGRGMETQHPNLTGLLTSSSHADSQQDFSASLSLNGAMASGTSMMYQQSYQQQQQSQTSNANLYSSSASNVHAMQVPSQHGHGPNSSSSGAPNPSQNTGHFSQIIISSQPPSSNVITINPGVTMSRSNSMPGMPSVDQMQGSVQNSNSFYQHQHLGKIEQGNGLTEVIHVQSANGTPVSLAAQSGSNSGAGVSGGGMQINMNLTQNINTGTTIINMTPAAAAQHHNKMMTSVSPHHSAVQTISGNQMNQHQQQQQSHFTSHQQPSPQLGHYVTNSQQQTTAASSQIQQQQQQQQNQNLQLSHQQSHPPPNNSNPSMNVTSSGGAVASSGSAATATVDTDKRKLIQQQLILLLHAHKCNKQDPKTNGPDSAKCKLPHCSTMKNVLQHLYVCQEGKSCRVAHCSSSRQIIQHWKHCNRPECPVCYPLKSNDANSAASKKSPGGALMQPGSVFSSPGSAGQPQSNMMPMTSPGLMNESSLNMQQQTQKPFVMSGNQQMFQPGNQNMMGSNVNTQNRPGPTIIANGHHRVAQDGSQIITSNVSNQNFAPHLMGSNQSNTQQQNVENFQVQQGTGQNVQIVGQQQKGRGQMSAAGLNNANQQRLTGRGHMMGSGQSMPTTGSNAQSFLNMDGMNENMGAGQNANSSSISNVSSVSASSTSANNMGAAPSEHNQYLMQVLRREGVEPPHGHKEWHEQVKENVRCLLVYKLVETIFPNPDFVMKDKRLDNLINYAKRVEVEMYDTAENKEDYFLRLAQKIYRIQKEIDDRHIKRNQQQNQNNNNSGQMMPMAPSVTQTPQSSQQRAFSVQSNWSQHQGQEPSNQSLNPTIEPKIEVKCEPMDRNQPPQQQQQLQENSNCSNNNIAAPSLTDLLEKEVNTPQSVSQIDFLPSVTQRNNANSVIVKSEPVSSQSTGKRSCEAGQENRETPQIKTEVKSEVKSEPNSCSMDTSVKKEPVSSSQEPAGKPGKPRNPKTFTQEELYNALWPALQKLYMQEDAIAFRQPVDPILLGIPDYFTIIKKPMDLSTIRKHLEEGKYKNPWEFIDDVQLMFNNAWLYNRKNTRVYKSCTKLSEIFDQNIDHIMEELGYCCGHTYVFLPQMLYCYSKNSCPIPKDAKYYQWMNRSPRPGLISEKYIYCSKCFQDGDPNKMTVTDEPMVPKAYSVPVDKSDFEELVNNKVEHEPFVECVECGRKWHQICALYHENIWPLFTCEPCLKSQGTKRKDNRFIAQKLPSNKLSVFLESRINKFTKAREPHCGFITIRVLSSSEKSLDAKSGLRSKHPEFPPTFPYKSKAIFAFETIDGTDICFFGMHVQEFGTDSSPPNKRHVYLSYLDSVHYFQPKTLRTAVYHEILINYLDYCKQIGYSHAHIWACPPGEGDDYIFHCHPPDQKIPKPKRLQDWYKKMMDKAIQDRVIYDYKDIMKSVEDVGGAASFSTTDLPYFEGDFWPNTIEDLVAQMDEEEKSRKKDFNSDEFSDGYMDDSDHGYGGTGCSTGDKKSIKAKKSKSKKSQFKSKKGNSPAADLSERVLSTMEKHRENFFTITITPNPTVVSIEDPDPLVQCELMDGRDSFLQMAREKFWEFSSLRRTKYSSMCFLYELHVQLNERMQYNCNNCKQIVEIRYHCNQCEDFDLCVTCNGKVSHEHELVRRTPESDAAEGGQHSKGSAEVNKKQAFMETLKNLPHAVTCRDANCRVRNCVRMRMIVQHAKNCVHKDQRNTCGNCKQFFQICCYHAKHCHAPKCVVPYCHNIRMKLRRQSDVLWQRRRAAMVGSAAANSSAVAAPQASSNIAPSQPAPTQMQKVHNHNQQQMSNPMGNSPGFNAQLSQPQQQPQMSTMVSVQSNMSPANVTPSYHMSQNMQGNMNQQTNQHQQGQLAAAVGQQGNMGVGGMASQQQSNPQMVTQMGGGNVYHATQQSQQQHLMISQQQQNQNVGGDMSQAHKQQPVSVSSYMQRQNMVPAGMLQQQQQPSVRHPQQTQFQRAPGAPQALVTQQVPQNSSQMMSAGTGNAVASRYHSTQPGNNFLVVRGTAPNMQPMQGKPGFVMTQIPRAMPPQMQQSQTQMMQSAANQGGMMHGQVQGPMRNAPQMMTIRPAVAPGVAQTTMGPNGQMITNRNATWQSQPSAVRPSIQQFQQQQTTTMYGAPSVQQRRFNDTGAAAALMNNQMMMSTQQIRPQQVVPSASSSGANVRTNMMSSAGGQPMQQQMHQDPKSGDDLSRFSDIL